MVFFSRLQIRRLQLGTSCHWGEALAPFSTFLRSSGFPFFTLQSTWMGRNHVSICFNDRWKWRQWVFCCNSGLQKSLQNSHKTRFFEVVQRLRGVFVVFHRLFTGSVFPSTPCGGWGSWVLGPDLPGSSWGAYSSDLRCQWPHWVEWCSDEIIPSR